MEKSDLKKWFRSIQSETDLCYMAMLTMAMFSNKRKYRHLSELPIILDRESFLHLLEVYGGRTITLPTKDEVLRYIQAISLYYYIEVEGLSNNAAMKKLGIQDQDLVELPMNEVVQAFKTTTPPGGLFDPGM